MEANMGQWLKADGTIETVKPANGKKFSLKELQDFVGGDIELVRTIKPVRNMYVNEWGVLNGLPYNREATKTISRDYLLVNGVRGDAIVCDRGEG